MEIYDFNPNHEGFHGLVDPINDDDFDFDASIRAMDRVLYYNASLHGGFDIIYENKIPVLTAAEAIDESFRQIGCPVGHMREVVKTTARFISERMVNKLIRTQAPPSSPFDVFTMKETDVPESMSEHLESPGGAALMLVNSFEVLEHNATDIGKKEHYRRWKSFVIDVMVELDSEGRTK